MLVLYKKTAIDMAMSKMCPFHLKCMLYLTGNVCCDVVQNFQVLLYLFKIQPVLTRTCVQQYFFVSIYCYHALQCIGDNHLNKTSMFVSSNFSNNSKKGKCFHKKITCFNGDIHCTIS